MRVSNLRFTTTKTGRSYRIRVELDENLVDLGSFRSSWLELGFFSKEGSSITIKDVVSEKLGNTVQLHGPWTTNDAEEQSFTGLGDYTLTAMIELVDQDRVYPQIEAARVIYDNRLNIRQAPLANPVKSIKLDYLSSSDEHERRSKSRFFARGNFEIVYKHLEANN